MAQSPEFFPGDGAAPSDPDFSAKGQRVFGSNRLNASAFFHSLNFARRRFLPLNKRESEWLTESADFLTSRPLAFRSASKSLKNFPPEGDFALW
jgi:hypothetical protein